MIKQKNKFIFKQSAGTKSKAIAFINEYYPELMPDIESYAKKNNADVGDIAAYTIKDIVLPTLKEMK